MPVSHPAPSNRCSWSLTRQCSSRDSSPIIFTTFPTAYACGRNAYSGPTCSVSSRISKIFTVDFLNPTSRNTTLHHSYATTDVLSNSTSYATTDALYIQYPNPCHSSWSISPSHYYPSRHRSSQSSSPSHYYPSCCCSSWSSSPSNYYSSHCCSSQSISPSDDNISTVYQPGPGFPQLTPQLDL